MVRSKKGNKKSNTKRKFSKKTPSVGKKTSDREYTGFNTPEYIEFSGFGTDEPETISEQIQSTNGFGLDRCRLYKTKRGCGKDKDCFFDEENSKCVPICKKLDDDDCKYHSEFCVLKKPGECVAISNQTIKNQNKGNSVNMYTPSQEESGPIKLKNYGKLSTSVDFDNLPRPASEVMRSSKSASKKARPIPKPRPTRSVAKKTPPKPTPRSTKKTGGLNNLPAPANEVMRSASSKSTSTKKKLEQQVARINNLPAPANEVMRSASSKSTSAKKRSTKKTGELNNLPAPANEVMRSASSKSTSAKKRSTKKTSRASNKSSRSHTEKTRTDVHNSIRKFKKSELKSSKTPKKDTFTIYKQISKLIIEQITTKTHAELLKNYVDTNKPKQSNKKGNEALEEEAQFINKLMIHAFLKKKEKKISTVSYNQLSQIINNILQSNKELHDTFKRITRRQAVVGSNEESNNWSSLSNSN